MHYGIEVVTFGEFADPRVVMRLAQAAEAAGWEGMWVWDHMTFPYGVGDPWVILSAVAARTSQLKLCLGVAPLPRYRPHVLARMLTALDTLSEGRVIFGTGLGAIDQEFTSYGECGDPKIRAQMLEEGLEVLTLLWSGERVTYEGMYYTLAGVRHSPSPMQKPRIPVWIGGEGRPALRRAARWDGWITGTINEHGEVTKTPRELAQQAAYIRNNRATGGFFEVAVDGISHVGQCALIREYEDAGATWWFESLFGMRGTIDEMLARI